MNTTAYSVWDYSPNGYKLQARKTLRPKTPTRTSRYRSQSAASSQTQHDEYRTLPELLDNGRRGWSAWVGYGDRENWQQSNGLYGNWQDNWRNTLTPR